MRHLESLGSLVAGRVRHLKVKELSKFLDPDRTSRVDQAISARWQTQ